MGAKEENGIGLPTLIMLTSFLRCHQCQFPGTDTGTVAHSPKPPPKSAHFPTPPTRASTPSIMSSAMLPSPTPPGGAPVSPSAGRGPPPSVTDEEFVRKAVTAAVRGTIGDNVYSHARTEQWTNAIVENLVMRLVSIDRDYKYVTTCMIVQKSGAGMRSATSCFWNAETDHGHSITMEHGEMYVITTIFVCKA